jgi:hypothetical protein
MRPASADSIQGLVFSHAGAGHRRDRRFPLILDFRRQATGIQHESGFKCSANMGRCTFLLTETKAKCNPD